MKNFIKAIFSILILSAVLFVSSCSKGKDHYLHAEPMTLQFSNAGGTKVINLMSTDNWFATVGDMSGFRNGTYVQIPSDQITISPQSGTGNTPITVTVKANNMNCDIRGTINIQSGSEGTYVYVTQSSGGGNDGNTGGGNTGNDNGNGNGNGNGNTGGGNDNTGGGNTGGGNTQQKPSAPTGVSVSNEGNNYVPDVRVRWNAVSNATKYYIYKSSSAGGSYSKIGESSYTSYADQNPPTNGASAYYKVKAVNSAGESAFSEYAQYTSLSNDEAFAPAYKYGSCTASGSTITLNWTYSTGTGYGKATKAVLRVWNPYAEEWQDTELSASATTASFNYSTKVDNDGYVKCGIVVSNNAGSFTAGAKVYDAKGKKWLN